MLKLTVLVVCWATTRWTENCLNLNRHYEALLINWKSTNCSVQQKCTKQYKNNLTDCHKFLSVNLSVHFWKHPRARDTSFNSFFQGKPVVWFSAAVCMRVRVWACKAHADHLHLVPWQDSQNKSQSRTRTSELGSQISGEMNYKSAMNKTWQPVAKGNEVEYSNKDPSWIVPWPLRFGSS